MKQALTLILLSAFVSFNTYSQEDEKKSKFKNSLNKAGKLGKQLKKEISKDQKKEAVKEEPKNEETNTVVKKNSPSSNVEASMLEKNRVVKKNFILGNDFMSIELSYIGDKIYLLKGLDKPHFGYDYWHLMDQKRKFQLVSLKKENLADSRQIANQQSFNEQLRRKSYNDLTEEEKEIIQKYKLDAAVKETLKGFLNDSLIKDFFSPSEGRFDVEQFRKSNYSPLWGGENNAFSIKKAYEKFIETDLLSDLENSLQSVPEIVTISMYARPGQYDFEKGGFKIDVVSRDIGKKSSNCFYYHIVPESEASEMELPNALYGILDVNVVKEDVFLKDKDPLEFEAFRYSFKPINNMVIFYSDRALKEELFRFNLNECKSPY